MSLILLVFVPLVVAGPVYFLRRYWKTTICLCLVTIIGLIGVCARAPLGEPAYLLGRELVLDELNRFLLLLLLFIAALMILYAWQTPQGWAFCPSLLAILGLLSGAMMIRTFLIAVLLLEMAGLVFVFMIHGRRPAAVGTALGYLVTLVIAAPCLLLVAWLAESYTLHPENLLLVRFTVIAVSIGFGILLAVVPFHSWLPSLVDGVPSMVGALLICVFGVASLALLIGVLNDTQWLMAESPILSVISIAGLLTAFVGGLLAFAQRHPGRLLAYAAIADMGFVLVALGTGSVSGVTGALAHVANRALVVLLVAMSLGSLRNHWSRDSASTLRDALPWAPGGLVGYVCGGLALGGFPLFGSFASRWLVYRSLPARDPIWLGMLLLSGVLVVLGYVRSLSGMMEGSGSMEVRREPLPLTVLILCLIGLCLVLGLFPGLLATPLETIVQGMPFIVPTS
jgi:formate hydrogenlyase subunit 3/multisubunit Na+/H+ antiporter MnhD subunit